LAARADRASGAEDEDDEEDEDEEEELLLLGAPDAASAAPAAAAPGALLDEEEDEEEDIVAAAWPRSRAQARSLARSSAPTAGAAVCWSRALSRAAPPRTRPRLSKSARPLSRRPARRSLDLLAGSLRLGARASRRGSLVARGRARAAPAPRPAP